LGSPIAAIIGISYVSLLWKTLIFSIIYYFFSGLGITAGYHRLFAHRAYEAVYLVRLFLVLGGTAALEGSVKWWCGGHRVHHRYTDTRKDPYNAKRGFWWAHVGWMLFNPVNKAKADIRDLQSDPIMNFQHTHYAWMGPGMAFIVPALIAHFGWNDFWGGLVYAGICRLIFVHHATFCVNSMAHYFGNHTYDDERSPRDHIITALVTIGEGYHNFHHEFPNDYRNGIRYFDYDPTKWLIRGLSLFGLTYNLKEFPANEIIKGKLQMQQKHLDLEKAKLMYPADIKSLPVWTWEDIKRKNEMSSSLVVVDGLVHDVSNFILDHPGGVQLIQCAIGKDATDMFNGTTKVYKHSQAARHLLTTFRVARLEEQESSAKKSQKSE
jgi:stearoyl-CoA desaturase (delta-9 desaturase)